MAAEFHNVNFTCAPSSIVPAGSNYTDIAFQTCAYAGSKIGSTVVNGDDYLATQFGFYYSHVWRNFGILCLFTIVFVGLTCWLSEVMEWELDSAGPIQYRASKKWFNRKKVQGSDEETIAVSTDPKAPPAESQGVKSEQTLAATESTFTWSDLELNVEIGKETRKLLDGVNGYCKPGTLTALVGASGAGKSTREFSHRLTRIQTLTASSVDCTHPTAKRRHPLWLDVCG